MLRALIRTASSARAVGRGATLLPRSAAIRSAAKPLSFSRAAPSPFSATVRLLSTEVPAAEEDVVSAPSADAKKFEFQAETRKLLDIVTHSIYTDKEVFLRELISNASDSLEKFRYLKSTGSITSSDDKPLEINITVNPKKRTLTISDNGIGMSQEELVANLGTIARSGSKQFVEQLKSAGGEAAARDGDGIIGQFGVGFYSAFMVSKAVSVESFSASAAEGVNGATWSSTGSGDFTIEPTVGVSRGSSIEMQLKETCKEYADVKKVKEIIKKYSNFVPFPIKVDGEVVNTISAIWVQDKNAVTEEQYDEFYKYISNAFDKPSFKLHFNTDAPIDLNALLFIPTFHTEKFGQGRMEAGVSLYSRKVLIEHKPKDLLPDWLRFIKGVVDSEDLPLSISREKPQDSMLLKKIKDVLTRKLLRVFADLQKNDPVKYKEFYIEFNNFLKEGICQDYGYQKQLSKLLLFESSALDGGILTSFDEYASRCKPDQKKIYYLVAPNRSSAVNSPYYETFKKNGVEVLFLYTTIDDFVMSNVRTYGDKALTSAEMSSLDLPDEAAEAADSDKDKDTEKKEETPSAEGAKLTADQSKDACAWLKVVLGSRVSEVKITNRLSDSPAIVTDHESGTMRRMIRMVEQSGSGKVTDLPPAVLEINPSHPIIKKLYAISADDSNSELKGLGELVAAQLLDNAFIAAGLVDDPRSMLPRLNSILSATLDSKK